LFVFQKYKLKSKIEPSQSNEPGIAVSSNKVCTNIQLQESNR